MDKYLYFPKCKITRADNLPGYQSKACTFFIKSLQNTPKHYPEHFMLKGKPDFFFKLNGNSMTWPILHQESFITIFGKDADLIKASKLIGREVSVLAYFDADANIKLDCIGIGISGQQPILFNNDSTASENEGYARIAVLGNKLETTAKKTKKLKI